MVICIYDILYKRSISFAKLNSIEHLYFVIKTLCHKNALF